MKFLSAFKGLAISIDRHQKKNQIFVKLLKLNLFLECTDSVLLYYYVTEHRDSAGVAQVDSQEPLGRIMKSLQHVPFLITV